MKAPATSGQPDFERYYRVQMNTLEQLVIFIPALWTFATFVNGDVAAILGAAFIVGRAMYFFGYVKAAEKRSAGFGLSTLATLALLIGGIIGAFCAM